jgi:ribosome biogenesis protein ERB1
MMAVAERGTARAAQKKRKERESEEDHKSAFPEAVGLEMMSDEETHGGEDDGDAESDEEVDEFPEIDARSDSESDEESNEDEEDEDSGDDDEEKGTLTSASDSDSGSDIHIFPKAKTIISEVTGHPKRVYPEIEPDYESDSSTEDVRVPCPMTCCLLTL